MRRPFFAPVLTALALAAPSVAHAESGTFNVHLEVGVLAPPLGGIGSVGVDWQVARPVALEVMVGGGAVEGGLDWEGNATVSPLFIASVGARFRLLDDDSGYPAEGGSVHGQLWVAPHVGVGVLGSGAAFVFDVGVGYELSIASPVSLGVYVRPALAVSDVGLAGWFQGGLTMSFEIDPLRDPIDPDRDHDGVLNADDHCPRTPEGTEVDERGCVPVVEVLVLEGITFAFDSAEIEPGAEDMLARAAQMLDDNAAVRVEIGGHTDDIGDPAHNERLSRDRAQSVAEWLVAHGIARERLRVRGYGSANPRVENADDTSRARNRRIEFRVIGR